MNNLLHIEIKEKALGCPICTEGNETQCHCTNTYNCSNIEKLDKLFSLAKRSDIYCFEKIGNTGAYIEKNTTDTAKLFKIAKDDCETCTTIKNLNYTKRKYYYLIGFAG